MSDRRDGPVLIELDDTAPALSPAEAPPVAEPDAAPTGQAMQTMAALAARRPSALTRWFWRLLIGVILFFASVAAWEAVMALLGQNIWLGYAAATLLGLFALVCIAIVIRELAALSRLARIEGIHEEAARIKTTHDLKGARALTDRITALYAGRDDLRWGRERLKERAGEISDADTLLTMTEDTLLKPLDVLAHREVEAAARQVATVTALVPLALADIITALTANVRMIRRIAEVYGGRSGALGGWRLVRTVMAHLVATGAVAVTDDLISSVGGGHLLARISRRFGEGLINGALTARVGVAAMEVCRPLPFSDNTRPRVTGIVRRALTGLFDKTADAKGT